MEPKYFDSSNFQRIQKISNDLYNEPGVEFLVAPTRTGKTIGVSYFVKGKPDTFHIEVRPAETGSGFWRRFLITLHEKHNLKASFTNATIDYMIENSSKILHELSRYRLIVIDEVGNFKPQFIKYVRQLMHNARRENCSVLLTSPSYALENIQKWETKGLSGISEFLSRIDYIHELPKHTRNDIRNLFKIYEVRNSKLENDIWLKAKSLGDAARLLKNYLKGR
ncbi:AAA family ATPase [Ekhidna sp.]